jgi:AcrR family transcriptional regulator
VPVTANRTSRQVLTQHRRAEILAAATKVFGKKSFSATRAEDIAAAAGIAKGTLYLYFRSKEDIYAAAIQAAINQLQELSAAKLTQANGLREKLTVAIAVRVEFWVEQQALYRLLLTVGREAPHRRQTNEILRSAQRNLLGILEDAVSSGELAPGNYCMVAWSILDLIRGCNERRLDRLATTTPQQDAEFITASALAMLGLCSGS